MSRGDIKVLKSEYRIGRYTINYENIILFDNIEQSYFNESHIIYIVSIFGGCIYKYISDSGRAEYFVLSAGYI